MFDAGVKRWPARSRRNTRTAWIGSPCRAGGHPNGSPSHRVPGTVLIVDAVSEACEGDSDASVCLAPWRSRNRFHSSSGRRARKPPGEKAASVLQFAHLVDGSCGISVCRLN